MPYGARPETGEINSRQGSLNRVFIADPSPITRSATPWAAMRGRRIRAATAVRAPLTQERTMHVRTLATAIGVAGIALTAGACGSSSTSSSSTSTITGAGSATTSATTSSTAVSYTCATGSLTLSGSTALQPLAQKAATDYEAKCPGAQISVSGGGSSTGLTNVANGQSDIGNSDVPVTNAKSIDPSTVTDHQVAIVIFAVIVNPKTGVTNLSTQQIQDVFSGKDTNWSQVGGNNVPISLVERKPGSGTRVSFDKDVMSGAPESSSPASIQDSTSLVIQGVTGADGGASYVNVATATSAVTAVSIDGVAPNANDLTSGSYKFYAHEHMYTKGAGSAIAQDFIDFLLTPSYASTITAQGFVPVSSSIGQSAADR
jgi:phosphate transport system substrate-binding protein